MNATSEYIPNQSDSNSNNGNGNGHHNHNGNGNGGKQRIFTLAPAQDQLTFVILETRRQAFEDPRLTLSEKTFFAHLLDLSLNRTINDRPGVITISQPRLGRTLGVSKRTIYTWKKNLCAAGYLWTSKKFVPNMWPLDVYHIAAIDEAKRDQKPTREGMWGNGDTRQAPEEPGLGARKPGQPGLPPAGNKSVRKPEQAKSEKMPAISTASGKSLRLPVEPNCDSQSKSTSTASRNSFRLPVEASFDSQSKQTSTDSRSKLPLGVEADVPLKRGSGKRIESSEGRGKGIAPPSEASKEEIKAEDQALADWRQSLNGRFPSALEKLRTKLTGQREQAASVEIRRFISRKIKMLDELLDGPMPADGTHPEKPAAKASPEPQPPTPEEMVAGAQYLVSIGKSHLLTAEQQKAVGL